MDGNSHDRQDNDQRQNLWSFLRSKYLILLVAYAVTVLTAALVFAPWAPIMAWFGFIYLVSVLLALTGLAFLVARKTAPHGIWKSMLWLALSSLVAFILTVLYAAAIVPLYSGTRTPLVIETQLFHSVFSTLAVLVVGVLWHAWLWQKSLRERRLSGLPA
ncbi:hypothetical protein [Brevibacterium limosum]|uniref:hypothetical protein n=1 Tax=Brevibacterium limosum TaxID=2697565 RepID=UPI00141E4EDB|nr:hypothetical protein [Brevibacterium limosum]